MTKEQRTNTEFYQKEIVRWLEVFGLGRWSIQWTDWDVVVKECPDFKYAIAASGSDIDSRLVQCSINPRMIEDASENKISRCALHEVTHVLTSRLEAFSKSDNMLDEEIVDEETEAIAKAMERAFFGPVDM